MTLPCMHVEGPGQVNAIAPFIMIMFSSLRSRCTMPAWTVGSTHTFEQRRFACVPHRSRAGTRRPRGFA